MLLYKCQPSGCAEMNRNNSDLHKIDPISEYITPNESKPNPLDTYRPNAVFCLKKVFS